MSVVVRAATPADGPAVLDLIDGLADYEQLPRPTADARARLLADGFGAEPRFRTFVAEVDGAPAGYAIWFCTYSTFLARPTAYLEDLFVVPAARGRGAGKALFAAVAREAVRTGCGRMEWAVLKWNKPAIQFYDAMRAWSLDEWQTYRLEGDALAAAGAA